MTASRWRKPTPLTLNSVNAKEQSTVHTLPEVSAFYLRPKELEVTIRAEAPADTDLRWDHISVKGAFLLYPAAERNVAKTAVLCLVSPAQYPDLAQPSVRFYEEIERDRFLSNLHRRPGRLIIRGFPFHSALWQ